MAWEGAADDPEITAKIAEYQATKSDSCVWVNMDEVTHIFLSFSDRGIRIVVCGR